MKLASAGVGCLAFAVTFLATGCSTPRREPPSEAAGAESSREATEEELDALARAERTAGRERRERIRAELREAAEQGRQLPRWAGQFGCGRYLELAVAPRAGMTICRSIDVVGTDRWIHADVVRSDDESVDMGFVLPREASCGPLGPRFHVATWSGRVFLVWTDRMPAFCDEFNHDTTWKLRVRVFGGYPNREDSRAVVDPSSALLDLPVVPEEFRKYFLHRRVAAKVVSVDETRPCGTYAGNVPKFETLATVDAGRDEQLVPGMTLRLALERGSTRGRIAEVAAETCRVSFEHTGPESKTVEALVVGALVTAGIDRTQGRAASDPDGGEGAVR